MRLFKREKEGGRCKAKSAWEWKRGSEKKKTGMDLKHQIKTWGRSETGCERTEVQTLENRTRKTDTMNKREAGILLVADCHGVNGILPLPVVSVSFETWPLHTERSLTLSSAFSRGPHLVFVSKMTCQQEPGAIFLVFPKCGSHTLCSNTFVAWISSWSCKTDKICKMHNFHKLTCPRFTFTGFLLVVMADK